MNLIPIRRFDKREEFLAEEETPAAVRRGPVDGTRPDPQMQIIPMSRIQSNAQPARLEEDMEFRQLVSNIKVYGILCPVGVQYVQEDDVYQVVVGERRYLAASELGLTEIPCRVLTDERDLTGSGNVKWLRACQLIENMHRSPLHPLDLARAINDLVDAGDSQSDIAIMLGKSESWVSKAMSISRSFVNESQGIEHLDMESLATIAALEPSEQTKLIGEIQEAEARPTQQKVRQMAKGKKKKSKMGRKAKQQCREEYYHGSTQVLVSFIAGYTPNGSDVILALREALKQAEQKHFSQKAVAA